MDEVTPASNPQTNTEAIRSFTGDAFGAGAALVVLPCLALYFGIDRFAAYPTIGLPVMAIFGIMILFGALALVATLFQRLQLTNPSQALALPEGSIRAVIALSLIVLFAIISIMLYRSMSEPYKVTGLTLTERTALLDKAADRVVMVNLEEPCEAGAATAALAASAAAAASAAVPAGAKPPCAPEDQRYTLHLRPPPAQESSDLAKQLLILVGTLMTSVTSFYFASRGASPPKPSDDADKPGQAGAGAAGSGTPQGGAGGGGNAAAAAGADKTAAADSEAHADGCNVDITDATPDEQLPAASGGVAK